MTAHRPIEPDSRQALLDAAETLFGRQGFGPTTIKQIGTEAGTNPALLYYYFTNKEDLYRAVLERRFSPLAQSGIHLLQEATPEDGIRQFVQLQAQYLRSHPDLPKLMVREMLDHEAAHAQLLIPEHLGPLFAGLCSLIARGQTEGVFRKDLDPRHSAISTIAQVVYVTLARPLLDRMPTSTFDVSAVSLLDSFASHAAEFALSALRVGKDGT